MAQLNDLLVLGNSNLIGETTIYGRLTLANTEEASLSSSTAAFRIGDINGTHLAIDGNEINAKSSSSASGTLYLNNEGGTVQVGTGGINSYGNINIVGSKALCWSSYGGGWYMSDTTYIRNYGSKQVLLNALLTTSSGASHSGIKIGDTYVTAIGGQLIFQNNSAIRFGTDSWDYNQWAGLKYDHSKKYIYLGLADGTIFQTNASQSGGRIFTPGIDYLHVGNQTTYYMASSGDTKTRTLTIGHSANQSTSPNCGILIHDLRSATITPGIFGDRQLNFYFDEITDKFAGSTTDSNRWSGIMHVKGWTGGYAAWELAGNAHTDSVNDTLRYRQGVNGAWGDWQSVLTDATYHLYTDGRYVNVTGDTMTGTLNMSTVNKVAIDFRPDHDGYHTTMSYQTSGNEALVFATKNAVTSFIFANGEDSLADSTATRWTGITPGLQIKNNCVAIGKLIANGSTPTYKLEVAGMTYSSGRYLSETVPSSWIDGQRYNNGAYNINTYSNADSYNPWMRAANSHANVTKWFSFGTLGKQFYWIGSTTSRTANGYDKGMTFNVESGLLYAPIVGGDRIYTGYDSGQAGSVSCSNWFRSSGDTGWYNASHGCHVMPNVYSSYGSVCIRGGEKGGYEGLHFGSNNTGLTVMSIMGSHQGLYNQSNTGWIIYNNAANGLIGVGTSSTNSGYKVTISGNTYNAGSLYMANNNITGVNSLHFADPGPDEGIIWDDGNGWKIQECPDDLSNAAGNLQFMHNSTRRLTINKDGYVDINCRLVVRGNGSSYNEGIRILPASNGWSNIFFSANTSLSGEHDGGWLIGRRGAAGAIAGAIGDFTIEEQSSGGANLTIHKDSNGATLQGLMRSTVGFQVQRTAGDGCGLGLYGSSGHNSYGIHMSLTGAYGKHGYVQGDWATYFCFDGATNRGWIFKQAGTNVASISGTGGAKFDNTVFGYAYTRSNNKAAFMWDKPGSNYTGVGANGTNDTIYFSACTTDGTWVTSYKQKWLFNGTVTADTFYGTLSGNATTASTANTLGINATANLSNCLQYIQQSSQTSGNDLPAASWHHVLKMNHGTGDTYYKRLMAFDFWNAKTVKTAVAAGDGKVGTWYKFWLEGDAVTSAVWNDYAECREADTVEAGYVLCETGNDSLVKTVERLQHFAGVSSDTWGFSQGETEKAKTPIAVAGRVLVYPYQDRNNYKPGDCVCAAPGGKVDIMTREEIINYPDRIVGTVSCVPKYDTWGGGENADREPVKVNGRIWIKVR